MNTFFWWASTIQCTTDDYVWIIIFLNFVYFICNNVEKYSHWNCIELESLFLPMAFYNFSSIQQRMIPWKHELNSITSLLKTLQGCSYGPTSSFTQDQKPCVWVYLLGSTKSAISQHLIFSDFILLFTCCCLSLSHKLPSLHSVFLLP